MSKLRHFFERLGWLKTDQPVETEKKEAPKSFWAELKAELRKRLVGYSAGLIFGAIALAFFLMGGYIVYDWIQDTKDRQRNFHEVCIDGYVLDTYEGKGIEGANVHIEGNPEWTHTSNTSGYFRICINIPKTQRSVNLTIEREDYVRQKYDKVAVPDNPNARQNIQHFNLTSVKKARTEPLMN